MVAGQMEDAAGLCLPSVKEGSDGFLAGVLELLLVFGVEEVAVGVDDGKRRDAMGDGDVVLLCHVDVVVDVASVDVDDDEVFGEQFGVGGLLVVVVEDLTVAAPVGAEVEDDSLVFAASGDHGGGDVGAGVCRLRVKVSVDVKAHLRSRTRNSGYSEREQTYRYGLKKRVARVRDHWKRPFRVHVFSTSPKTLLMQRFHSDRGH
jgi:hypothetical protein